MSKWNNTLIDRAVTKGLTPNVKFKPSGVDWIGDIPEEWEVMHMKRHLTINNGRDYKHIEVDEGYPVIGSGGVFANASEFLYEGEALLLGRKGTIDKPLYIDGKFWTVDTMFYAIPDKKTCCKYMYYQASIAPLAQYSTNTALPSMTQTSLQNLLMCFPPFSEQQSIASYLDEKCGKIDTQISLLSQKRDAYLQLKRALINRVVTKGLNPDAKFKPSGVDWIREIPEGWEVKRIKEICDFVSRGTTPDYADESKYKVMNQATFSKGYIDDSIIRYTSKPSADANIKRGDLLIASTGGGVLGKVLFYNRDDKSFYADSHVSILRNTKGENSMKFLYYVFSTKFAEINATMVKGSTNQTELQRNYLLAHEIPIPKKEEQQSIASYLDEKCGEIDANIANIEKQIEKYKELKRALISEVVTGKRTV